MCSVSAKSPTNAPPQYIHNPYLDGGAYGNSVLANRIGTSSLTIGLDPTAGRGAVNPGLTIPPPVTYNPGGSPNTPDTPGSSSGGGGNGPGNTGGGGSGPGNPGQNPGIHPALN